MSVHEKNSKFKTLFLQIGSSIQNWIVMEADFPD